jgi:hypothetical protein
MKPITAPSTALSILALATACGGVNDEPEQIQGADDGEIASTRQALVEETLQYMRNAQSNTTTCTVSAPILVVTPDAPGTYPVFIYFGGTSEAGFTNSTRSILNEAATQGFLAAAVSYENVTLPPDFCGPPPGFSSGLGFNKVRCAFSSSPTSAVSTICAHPKAGGCTQGIVTSGFSQGAAIATMARNFNTRVRGTWATGFSNINFAGAAQPCFNQGVRLLANTRLRVTNGVNQFGTNLQPTPLASYNQVTGRNCSTARNGFSFPPFIIAPPVVDNCLNGPNGSGWKVALTSELSAGNTAQHCFMQINQPCNNVHTTDPVFAQRPPLPTFASGQYQNVLWLKNAILPLGNQP